MNHSDILSNLKQIFTKYQELLTLFLDGKGHFLPKNFINYERLYSLITKLHDDFISNPAQFSKLHITYTTKWHELITNSLGKFLNIKTIEMPNIKDRRFNDPLWQNNPYYYFLKQAYFIFTEWLCGLIENSSLEQVEKRYLSFLLEQFINASSPSNFLLTNPVVIQETLNSNWTNILHGLDKFLNDIKSYDIWTASNLNNNYFKLGDNIAATKGKIIIENELMQLICYQPAHLVYETPILILPPWINKYYILDLAPNKSLVEYLIGQGFQVFIISWVNPSENHKEIDFEDYLSKGSLTALNYIKKMGFKKIHLTGYCIGGTLAVITTAYLSAKKKNYIASLSLFTTLLDFANAGDIKILIDKRLIDLIEKEVTAKGYFDGRYLANCFNLLKANDMIWSYFINNYLLNKEPINLEILYWNSDSAHLPGKMYIYYLENMYYKNLLTKARALKMLDTPINLELIKQKCFFVATKQDHIAPWRAVYDSAKLIKSKKTFCLASGGHISGIINCTQSKNQFHYLEDKKELVDNEEYFEENAHLIDGSWWNHWTKWLISKNTKKINTKYYKNFASCQDAPGNYVKQKHYY